MPVGLLGGPRLLTVFFHLLIGILLIGATALAVAGDLPSRSGPPKAKVAPVVDMVQGHKIVDPYRYLENPSDPATKTFVDEELAYTRSILDPLPGRDKINARLTQLLAIGTVGAPQVGGKYYFHTRRDAGQNQPALYVRDSLNGEDRVLVDPNKLSADATVALDWWFASHDGKYVAYGTSQSGSEESTLRIIETATGQVLPDTIDRTRFASLVWLKDNSGFYYTRHPRKGDVPAGEEVYHVKAFYHQLGTDPAKDPLIFEDKRNPQYIPDLTHLRRRPLAADQRRRGLGEDRDVSARPAFRSHPGSSSKATPVELTTGKDFLYGGDFFRGKLYITTNEDAPHYRVFVADAANPKRANWKELIPETDAVLQNASVTGGKLFLQYEHNVASELMIYSLEGKKLADIPQPAIGNVPSASGRYDLNEIFYSFTSFTVPPCVYRYDLTSGKSELWAKVDAPSIDPAPVRRPPGVVSLQRRHQDSDVHRQQKRPGEERP